MSRGRNLQTLRNEVAGVTDKLDYELVDVEFVKENSDYFLRVYIHKEGGVQIEDCQKTSELLSEILDEKDLIDVAYYLEVSSPGLDRPLKTDRDLERNLGKDIELSLYKSLNGMKKLEGSLESYDDENITIKTEVDEIIEIPKDIISLNKLAIKF